MRENLKFIFKNCKSTVSRQQEINCKFNKEKKLPGYNCLNMFLKRHSDLNVQKSGSVSLSLNCQSMSSVKIDSYFQLLEQTLRQDFFKQTKKYI